MPVLAWAAAFLLVPAGALLIGAFRTQDGYLTVVIMNPFFQPIDSAILFASSIQFLLMSNFTFTVKSMADVVNKYAENVAGAFYVDDQCIDCDLCRETAPASFKRNDDGGHTYVYKQPETPEEEALCKEAMEGCPVEAIGNNGEEN